MNLSLSPSLSRCRNPSRLPSGRSLGSLRLDRAAVLVRPLDRGYGQQHGLQFVEFEIFAFPVVM